MKGALVSVKGERIYPVYDRSVAGRSRVTVTRTLQVTETIITP